MWIIHFIFIRMLPDVYLHTVLKPPQRGAKPIMLDPQTNKSAYEKQVWRLQDSSTLSGSLCVFSTWLKGLTIVRLVTVPVMLSYFFAPKYVKLFLVTSSICSRSSKSRWSFSSWLLHNCRSSPPLSSSSQEHREPRGEQRAEGAEKKSSSAPLGAKPEASLRGLCVCCRRGAECVGCWGEACSACVGWWCWMLLWSWYRAAVSVHAG